MAVNNNEMPSGISHMDNKKKISMPVVKRLPRYYRHLGDLLDNNITRISSKDLSERMKVTASQIRQDLNNFGCFGQQGYGYNVELLYKEIQTILSLDKIHNIVIIGGGNIGQALLNYSNFSKRGFNFTAVFDINPKLIGLTIRGIEIQDVDKLEEFLTNNKVDIVVLAVPKSNALDVVKTVLKCNIKGIWNFSHVDINAPEDVVVENVHLTDSLMTLSYKLNEADLFDKD